VNTELVSTQGILWKLNKREEGHMLSLEPESGGEKKGLTYKDSGVDYGTLDEFKRVAQKMAAGTSNWTNLTLIDFCRESRGEPAQVFELEDRYLATVLEGLGTKNRVVDEHNHELNQLFGESERGTHYHEIGLSNAATILNDLAATGAAAFGFWLYLATGSSDWFKNRMRSMSLLQGTVNACKVVGCTFAGGETPVLKDVINPDTCVLGGCAVGSIKPKERRITGNVESGDAIIFLTSSGPGENGLTLIRTIAASKELSLKYRTPLSDGTTLLSAVLKPSHLYGPFIQACLMPKSGFTVPCRSPATAG
jgi:phosphoribosylformylglycinamidine cyclo-ligase